MDRTDVQCNYFPILPVTRQVGGEIRTHVSHMYQVSHLHKTLRESHAILWHMYLFFDQELMMMMTE